MTTPDIFAYSDYRIYLRDVIQTRRYTLSKFARKLGFSSHAGLAMVLTGKRELGNAYIVKTVQSLKLNLRQQIYLEAMVRSDRLSIAKRRTLLAEIEKSPIRWDPPAAHEGIRMVDFFLAQQILALYRGYVPFDVLQRHFRYRIEKKDLQAVLSWMLDKGHAEASPQGYRIAHSRLLLEDDVPSAPGKQFHKDCLKLAASALDTEAIKDREFQTFLLTVNSKRIPELKKLLKTTALQAISDYEDELEGDTVVQLHFNLFELSNRVQRSPA